jgi:putative flippase GtrA
MENNVKNTENEIEEKAETEENTPSRVALLKKKLTREVLMYLLFGVLTTLVGWIVYFAIMIGGRILFKIPQEDTASGAYFALYTAAQIIQWVCAVLFAFFTNRKWVFTDADKNKSALLQLLTFSGGRVVTLVLDYVITLFGGMLLVRLLPALNSVAIGALDLNVNEIFAKVVAAVVVIIGNYFFSKFLVFKGKKSS